MGGDRSAVSDGWVGTYLRGACMGAADAVPGVSGGTIALLTGIYERLVAAITAVTVRRVCRLALWPLPAHRGDARAAFDRMDTAFLLVLLAGVGTAVVTVSRLLDYLLAVAPVPTFGAFFGLIAASAVVLAGDVSLDTPGRVVSAVAGFVLAFVGSGSASAALGSGPLVTLLAGAVAVSAMLLPGISGSLLLLILGQYERLVHTLRVFVDALLAVSSGGVEPVVEPATTVGVFVSGALVGLFTVAHGVRYALERRREATLAFLVSLVVGALRAPVVRATAGTPAGWTTDTVAAFILPAVLGVAVVLAVERVS